jgi:predicted kinase
LQRPLLIVVNGAPAAGKTMLAAQLERSLGLPGFSKDGFKETLYEIDSSERWLELLADRAFNSLLGAAAIRLMFEAAETVLASGGSVLIEANLRPDLAGPALAAIEERTGCRLLQVFVDAESETLIERFVSRQRSEQRHFGHRMFDGEGVHVGTQLTESYPRLDITDTIGVDTTDLDALDYTPVVEAVRTQLAAP